MPPSRAMTEIQAPSSRSLGTDPTVRSIRRSDRLGRSGRRLAPHRPAQANAVAIQPDGLITVTGSAGTSFALARYLPDGSLDPSFSSDGKLLVSVVDDPTLVTASGVALTADGRIVVGGWPGATAIAMCSSPGSRANGASDQSFGQGGVVLVRADMTRASNLVVQSDGRLVIGADRSLYRFEPDGSLDPSFSDDGILPLRHGAAGVAIAADGSIVVAGPGRREPWGVQRLALRSGRGSRTQDSAVTARLLPSYPASSARHSQWTSAQRPHRRGGHDERGERRRRVRRCALPRLVTLRKSATLSESASVIDAAVRHRLAGQACCPCRRWCSTHRSPVAWRCEWPVGSSNRALTLDRPLGQPEQNADKH